MNEYFRDSSRFEWESRRGNNEEVERGIIVEDLSGIS